ncbi:MAG: Glycosyl transferase, WecB/TagA/CpsF family [Parcubacteria group bacterium GW2011_GWC2_45_7]|nr:MAG: Glycosyl transferase, WecB/TagA/CpsF family [Parcubacteria group bacterium GW2011_GWC2_45_7]
MAFGQIKQEKWIAKHLGDLRSVKIAIGVGGAFDFIAGRVRRAPLFLRLLGLEWFWRLLRQPWRLPRIYRAVIKFSYFILKAKLARVQHPDKY